MNHKYWVWADDIEDARRVWAHDAEEAETNFAELQCSEDPEYYDIYDGGRLVRVRQGQGFSGEEIPVEQGENAGTFEVSVRHEPVFTARHKK